MLSFTVLHVVIVLAKNKNNKFKTQKVKTIYRLYLKFMSANQVQKNEAFQSFNAQVNIESRIKYYRLNTNQASVITSGS